MNISYQDGMSNTSEPNVAILDDKSSRKTLALPRKPFHQIPGRNVRDSHNNIVHNEKLTAVIHELRNLSFVNKDGIYQKHTSNSECKNVSTSLFVSSNRSLSSSTKKSIFYSSSPEKMIPHESLNMDKMKSTLPCSNSCEPNQKVTETPSPKSKHKLSTPPPIRPKPAHLCNTKAVCKVIKIEKHYQTRHETNGINVQSSQVVSNIETSESENIYEDVIPIEFQNLTQPNVSKQNSPNVENCKEHPDIKPKLSRHNSVSNQHVKGRNSVKRQSSLDNKKSGIFSVIVSAVKDLGSTTTAKRRSNSVFYSESDNEDEIANIDVQKDFVHKERKLSSVFYDDVVVVNADDEFCGVSTTGSLPSSKVCDQETIDIHKLNCSQRPETNPVIVQKEILVSDIIPVNNSYDMCSNPPLIQITCEETNKTDVDQTSDTDFHQILNSSSTETYNNNDISSISKYDDNELVKSEKSKKEYKVFKIAEEMMLSEQVFVDVLRLLNEDFRKEIELANMESDQPIIPDINLNQILMYLPQLQTFNEQLLQDLTDRIANWEHDPRIADIIIKKGPFLKLYTSYIKEFERMTSTLDDALKKYRQFSQVVKSFEMSARCKKLALKHYMLKPIQRIPQYKLLLEDYLKHLSENDIDYKDAIAALKIVSEVADHINDSMKQGEALEKMVALQNCLQGYEIIKPGRILLKEGNLLKLSRKGIQPRKFFLFNDCLLYVTSHENFYKVNHELPLVGMKVSIPASEGFENEFSILSIKRSIRVSVQTSEERDEWIKALSSAIDKVTSRKSTFVKMNSVADEFSKSNDKHKLGEHAPVWIPDARVTMCQICLSEFTLTFRRHHCRACGKVICSECSQNRFPLAYINYSLARVCDECSHVLEMEENDKEMIEEQSEASLSLKKSTSGAKEGIRKIKRYVPNILKEVSANDEGAKMSGYLNKRKKNGWKKFWFVLKDKVLYTYKASQDCAALEATPILGYTVHDHPQCQIELVHSGQPPILFQADSEKTCLRWIKAMKEACVL